MIAFYTVRGVVRRAFFLACACLAAVGSARAQSVPPGEGLVADSTELRVLRELYAATGGPNWTHRDQWLTGTTLANVATWYGVQTDGGDVVGLTLEENGLNGALPPALGRLAGLRNLNLYHNALHGAVPVTIGQLRHLGDLVLASNQFTGSLPTEVGRCTELRVLNLSENHFSGPLPDSLGRCTRLLLLYLGSNGFTGQLPVSLGNLRSLQQFYAPDNALEGPLPASLSNLRSMWVLHLNSNRLSGAVPPEWGRLHLGQLFLGNNRLSGSLPDSLGRLGSIDVLELNNNRFTGTVPASYKRLHPSRLSLAYNDLSGPLPDSLDAAFLWLDHNRFTGAVPASFVTSSRQFQLKLDNNELTQLPDFHASRSWPNQQVTITGNYFEFDSYERNLRAPGVYQFFYDYGQRTREPADTTLKIAGEMANLSGAIGGAHNHYQWQRLVGNQWADMPGDTLATRHFAATTPADAGSYRTRVTNRWVVAITLYSRTQYLDVLPYLARDRNLPVDANRADSLRRPLTAVDTLAAPVADMNFVRTWTPRVALTDAGHADRGTLLREQWDNVGGVAGVADVPVNSAPTSQSFVSSFEGPVDLANNYGSRLRGYLFPPQTGNYTLWLAADDVAELWLSTDADPAHRVRIAYVQVWTASREWNKYPEQHSVPVMLEAGRRYYVEVLHREFGGGDNLAVAWQRPDGTFEGPIAGQYLAPPGTAPGNVAEAPDWTVDEAQRSTTYLDGLGRPVQTVLHQASPARRDLVQPQAYDALGREIKQFLPYADTAHTTAQGYHYRALNDQQWFYRRTTPPNGGLGPLASDDPTVGVARTGAAFAETHFEASPLNRVAAQGAAGEPWQLTAGHVVERTERPNTEADSVLRFQPGYDPAVVDPGYQGFYAPGELWGTDVADAHGPNEPGAHGYRTVEWKDKEGRVVLRQVEAARTGTVSGNNIHSRWLRTAYAYDDFGYLRYVVQPEGTKRLLPLGDTVAALPSAAAPYLFHYRYDGRGRQIAKQVPGTDGETVVVFDQLDRPVLSQDAAQRLRQEWSWTKYDALGRVILSGVVQRPDGAGRETLQALAAADTLAINQYEQRTADSTTFRHFYTTNHSFPRLGQNGFTNGYLLSATYYDDYNFNNDAAGTADASYNTSTDAQFPNGAAPVADALRTTGLATRTKTRVLGVEASDQDQADWLTTTTFYDERARPVQVQTTNARKNRLTGNPFTDLLTTQLDFTGKVVQSVAVHAGPSHTPMTVAEFFTYDHTGRLLTTRQQLPGEAQPMQIASVQYNEIGQAVQKTMGTGRLAQTVKYEYNIRGWLTQLNNPYYPEAQNLFNLSLHYDRGFTTGYEQYNGNLTGQTWRGRDGVHRAYGYVYDPLNRLLQGDFVARAGTGGLTNTTGAWTGEFDNYRLSFASYDDNGNLLTLRRRGLLANATHATTKQFGPVDNLLYAYVGNHLQAVNDNVTGNQLPRPRGYEGAPTSLAGDFQEGGTHLVQEYLYDANGNLTQDRNKGITGIAYNHLNLPRQIHFGIGGDSIVFRYTAAGQKVAKLVYQSGKPTLRTDYLGPYQYEQDSLRFFPHAEGRVLRFAQRDAARQWHVRYEREFTFKDHLGNMRMAYRSGHVRTLDATLEQDSTIHRRESQQFDSLSVSSPVAQNVSNVGGRNMARTGSYVALLNAAPHAVPATPGAQVGPTPLGPLTQFAVQKGDTVRATAFGLYPQATSSNSAFSLVGFIASLLQPAPATGVPAGPDGSRRGALPLLQVGLNAAPLAMALTQLPGGVPKGYLRMLVFNEDSVLVGSPITVQLQSTALNNYDSLNIRPFIIQQNGYVSVYVGNESAADVYFDDVTIEHRQGLQVQENQYDPFGLDLAGANYASPGIKSLSQYKFNGKEFQADLGLNWNHQDWRFFDYQIGQWHAVDPEIENGQESWTPYSFGYDNAVRYADANGRCPGGCPPPDPAVVGTISQHQPNRAEKLSTAIDVVSTLPGGEGIGLAARVLYNVANDAHVYATGFFDRGNATTLEGHTVNRNEYQQAGFSTLTTLGNLAMGGAASGAAREAASLAPAAASEPTAAQQAAGWQGKGNYPGVDKWRDVTLKPGTVVHAGEPGGGNFATTSRGLQRAGGSASKFSQGLQVGPHPVHGYRPTTAAYTITSETPAAMGTTYANPQHGVGGLPQLYIPNLQQVAQKGAVTPFVTP
ncbi:DUF6443 domain-containing protein [Hymenobacter convexus]|uniref:DUF6443 domain-containing protein n=1 Tax=Hymenobacter sp. CA1UV-4 TaxID=3063782 RepID=UPI0027130E37|nr:DUF6443 domain-containing protein [Hymenobacter sp. CA1UV-4]MDO7852968.1 DUF6443 domain-containing protein [Hymenobacter sp. CA1UV-4]